MARTIRARYEKGALRLLEPVGLAEGAAVEVTIVPERWNERLQSLLDRVRARVRELPPDEVEAEISRAADEVRAKRLGRH